MSEIFFFKINNKFGSLTEFDLQSGCPRNSVTNECDSFIQKLFYPVINKSNVLYLVIYLTTSRPHFINIHICNKRMFTKEIIIIINYVKVNKTRNKPKQP